MRLKTGRYEHEYQEACLPLVFPSYFATEGNLYSVILFSFIAIKSDDEAVRNKRKILESIDGVARDIPCAKKSSGKLPQQP
jgi:hypothetical protein